MEFIPKDGEIVALNDLVIVNHDRRVRSDQIEVHVALVFHRVYLLPVRTEPDVDSGVTFVDV